MEDKASRKRPLSLSDDEDANKASMQKRVRFPKGKKVKAGGDEVAPVIGAAQAPPSLSDPRVAAEERAKLRVVADERAKWRSKMTTDLFSEESRGLVKDITEAEENYEDNADFVDDGVPIEPFNLNQEREEGYFDAAGNFVEYANENNIKDAWLDSVAIDSRYAGKNSDIAEDEEDTHELSSEDIGKIKRRIADLLEPEETVLHALRRLKGTSTDKKEKMPEEVKLMFDQLTEDSMKLMENGDYNVYHDKQEVFEREAEGYERLARAKDGTSIGVENDHSDELDMFAEDDGNPSTNDNGLGPSSTLESNSRPSSESVQTNLESGDAENDYVYDESSGYYYSSTLGYYYDPASGLYCCANSGKWYSYNEQTSIYEEVHSEAEPVA